MWEGAGCIITSCNQRHTHYYLSLSVAFVSLNITTTHHSSGRDATMQKHIFQPIPKLDGLASREDRLKTIIANLEKHERDVKYASTPPQLY